MPLANYLINVRYFAHKKLSRFLGGSHYHKIYNDTFYDNQNQNEVLGSTPDLVANYLIGSFQPASVIDFGCGTGIYLQALARHDIEVMGIDASPAAVKNFRLRPDQIIIKDLTQPLLLGKKYDCALCFEVAEHIPHEYSENLIANLCRVSDLIIFSAAAKGQGGIGHINEQAPEFWRPLFEQHGFACLEAETMRLKNYLKANHAVFWLANNILIFKKPA